MLVSVKNKCTRRMYPSAYFLLFVLLTSAVGLASAKSAVKTAAQMLRERGIALTEAGLIAALGNSEHEIRELAADQLALYNDKDAIPFIQTAAASESKLSTRLDLASSLAKLGDPSGTDLLKNTCSDESVDDYTRLQAANNMLLLHSDACFLEVLSILESTTNEEAAIDALYFCFNSKFELTESARPTPDSHVKREATVLTLVGKRLADQDSRVRMAAGDVLMKIGNRSQVPVFQDAIARETDETLKADLVDDLERVIKRSSTSNSSPPAH